MLILRLDVLVFLLVQIQLKDMALVDLSGVGGGLPRATPAEVAQVKSRSNSASPRWT